MSASGARSAAFPVSTAVRTADSTLMFYEADCLDVFASLPAESISVIVTSPPSGLERDLAVGHYKPINSKRFLNDCHEFIFHFTPSGEELNDRGMFERPATKRRPRGTRERRNA